MAMPSAHQHKRTPLASTACPAAPPFASASSPLPSPSASPSPSPPLFMCCVSLPGPLQPLSLPSPSPPSSSPSSSSSSSTDLPPSGHSLPTLSQIAHIEPSKPSLTTSHSHLQRSHVAELLLFRGRKKPALQNPQGRLQQPKQQSKHSLSTSCRRGHSQQNDILDPVASNGKQYSSKGEDHRNSWELLKSGEVSNLIKQGFMERTQRRHSPGRVSPLMQETLAASAEIMSPLYTSTRKVTAGQLHSARAMLATSSPPLDKTAKPNTLSIPPDKSAKENTLFNMMSRDAELRTKQKEGAAPESLVLARSRSSGAVLDDGNARNPLFNNAECSDVNLVLKGRDGGEVCLSLHSCILVERSKYFAARLSEAWCNQQKRPLYFLEIKDCEDLEVFQEVLHLLYCQDLQARLIKCNVSRVLAILKVAALILFESCIVCCLEYLEAAPWAEEEEGKVKALLGQLQIGNFTSTDVLKRLKSEESCGSEETLVQLLEIVTKGKDNKARREMKALVSKMLRENLSQNRDCTDLSRESLYQACTTCLDALSALFVQASRSDIMNQGNEDRGTLIAEISHQADNLLWLLEILLDRHLANDFVKMWAHQSELARIHKEVATVLRFEVSRLTARLCVAIGRGQVLCPVDVRYTLLQTWLPPLVDDFGWMQRCCRGLDKNVVEDGISQTILTLPLKQQQNILLAWFDRFSNNGDDCPNLQRAFEVWWRRTFLRSCTDQ
ncbi:hypothetical protein L7F22_042768 [Adiantum nelumboides]|nr:hypothetical protein [Adiantum nelumboides]